LLFDRMAVACLHIRTMGPPRMWLCQENAAV
jgi:hypothetical protein